MTEGCVGPSAHRAVLALRDSLHQRGSLSMASHLMLQRCLAAAPLTSETSRTYTHTHHAIALASHGTHVCTDLTSQRMLLHRWASGLVVGFLFLSGEKA